MTNTNADAPVMTSANAAATDEQRAAHSLAIQLDNDSLPDWVQLLPRGTFRGRDGRGPYHLREPHAVVAASGEMFGRVLPVDYGHALEQPGRDGDGAPASGWMTELQVRDGEIWARVEWTSSAAQRIRDREYRFISPVFVHQRDGTVVAIQRAGLTNRPNLLMQSINSQTTEKQMAGEKTFAQRIAAAFGMEETATEEAVIQRCTAAAAAQEGYARVAQSLQLDGGATSDQLVRAVQSRSDVDPQKYVPREQYDALQSTLQSTQAEKTTAAVDAAIAAGKITPAQREWAQSYHSQDPAAFDAFVAAAPKVVGERSREQQPDPSRQLDDTAKAVCAALDISQDAYRKNVEA